MWKFNMKKLGLAVLGTMVVASFAAGWFTRA